MKTLLFLIAAVWSASAAFAQTELAPMPKPEIRAAGVCADGAEMPLLTLRVEEFLLRGAIVLPNVVYFDSSNPALPDRYRLSAEQRATFRPRYLGIEGVQTRLLDLLGYRLREQPQAIITLRGEQRRVEAVRQYLSEIWEIPPSRAAIQAVSTPPKNKEYSVEIVAHAEIFAPYFFDDTLRTASPPIIRFYTKVFADVVPTQWAILPKQRTGNGNQEKTLKSLSGTGKVRPVIDWKVDKEKNSIPLDSLPMTYQLDVRHDGLPNQKSNRGSFPVEQITLERKRQERIADTLQETFAVLGFASQASKLSALQKAGLETIRALYPVQPRASVVVRGSFAASEPGGKRLAEARAKAVAEALGLAGASAGANADGKAKSWRLEVFGQPGKDKSQGKSQGKSQDQSPEEAALWRSVSVSVATPARYEASGK